MTAKRTNASQKQGLQAALSDHNLHVAYRKVLAYYRTQNYAESPDGALLQLAEPYLFESLRTAVLAGQHQFQPLRTYTTPKSSGGQRVETISSPVDRLLIQALFNGPGHLIQAHITETVTFNNVILAPAYRFRAPNAGYMYSYWPADYRAYRNTAIRMARRCRDGVVLHTDIRTFFPSIRRDRLRTLLKPWFHADVWPLIDAYLRFRVEPGHPQDLVYDGLPIDEPISRLLANLYLEALDRLVLHELDVPYTRYVDDMMFFLPSESIARDVEDRVAAFIRDTLGLNFNQDKREVKPTQSVARGDDAEFSRRLSVLNAGVGLLGWKPGLRKGLLAAFKELLEEMPSPNATIESKNRNLVRGAKFAAWRSAKIRALHLVDHISLLLGDERSRTIAAISLAHLGTPRALQAIQQWYAHAGTKLPPHDRVILANALARNGKLNKLKSLTAHAQSHPELRAILMLHARACKEVKAGLNDPDTLVRRAAIINFATRTRGLRTLLPEVIRTARIESNRDTLLLFFIALADYSENPRVMRLLKTMRQNEDQLIRETISQIQLEQLSEPRVDPFQHHHNQHTNIEETQPCHQ